MKTWRLKYPGRAKWPAGVWNEEPDKVYWMDLFTGYPCRIIRSEHGSLCGYVGLDDAHPFYAVDYNAIDNIVPRHIDISPHGGLTFSGYIKDTDVGSIPAPEYKFNFLYKIPLWWFGFDCAHYYDFIPGFYTVLSNESENVYRDIPYLEAELKKLAKAFYLIERHYSDS